MGHMETFITVRASALPTEYIRFHNSDPDREPIGPNDVIEELPVEIEYGEGCYTSGNTSGHPDTWTPSEGEDPHIESVTIVDEGYGIWDAEISPSALGREQTKRIIKGCWEHQQHASAAYEPDYDYDDDYGYEPDY